jgi:hypothetical protein
VGRARLRQPRPGGEPFETWLGSYPQRVGPFDTTQLVEIFRLRVPVAANWKLYIENHVDVLHLWYLHHETLGMYDHTGFLHDKVGRHWVSEERLRPARSGRGACPASPTCPRASTTCSAPTCSSRTSRRRRRTARR